MKVADLHFGIAALGLVAAVGVAYLLVLVHKGKGRIHHARADADGGSVFLGKPVMEMAYWGLEPLVGGLAALHVTPTMVTLFALIPAFGAALAAAVGWFALSAVLGMGAALCDLLDGLLARRLGSASDAGEALDAVVDRYTEFLFMAGIAVHYRTSVPILLLALSALFGSLMVSYTTAKGEAMKISLPRGHMRRPERAVYLLVGAALTAVTKALVGESAPLVVRELPILLSLFLVAAVTQLSNVARLRVLVVGLRSRLPESRPQAVPEAARSLSPGGRG